MGKQKPYTFDIKRFEQKLAPQTPQESFSQGQDSLANDPIGGVAQMSDAMQVAQGERPTFSTKIMDILESPIVSPRIGEGIEQVADGNVGEVIAGGINLLVGAGETALSPVSKLFAIGTQGLDAIQKGIEQVTGLPEVETKIGSLIDKVFQMSAIAPIEGAKVLDEGLRGLGISEDVLNLGIDKKTAQQLSSSIGGASSLLSQLILAKGFEAGKAKMAPTEAKLLTELTPKEKVKLTDRAKIENQNIAKQQEPNKFEMEKKIDLTESVPLEAQILDRLDAGGTATEISQALNVTSSQIKSAQRGRRLAEAEARRPLLQEAKESVIETAEAQSLREAIKDAGTVRKQLDRLRSDELGQVASRVATAREGKTGEAQHIAGMSAMSGERIRPNFEPVRDLFTQDQIDNLYSQIDASGLQLFEKQRAGTGLSKLLSETGGQIPQPSELKLLGRVFGEELVTAIGAKRSKSEVFAQTLGNIINLPRAIMTSVDMSAPLRQGLIFSIARPKESAPAFRQMVKSFFSEKSFRELQRDIETRPNLQLYEDAGLFLSEIGENVRLSAREEAFMSKFAGKIPVVAGSQRAYTGFLNKLRADVFDNISDAFQRDGINQINNPQAYRDLANYVNRATGRGKLATTKQADAMLGNLLTNVFFSPRNMAAKAQVFMSIFAKTPQIKKAALKDLLVTTSAIGSILGLAKAAGADVETDALSSDFAKVKIGDTRVDLLGGFQQPARFLTQLVAAQRKSLASGNLVPLDGSNFYGGTQLDLTEQFFRGKLAPQASLLVDYLDGKRDMLGRKMGRVPKFSKSSKSMLTKLSRWVTERSASTLGETATGVGAETLRRISPFFLRDTFESIEDLGLGGASLAVPAFFGVGVSTFDARKKRKSKSLLKGL